MSGALKVAVAGLGTVGAETVRLLGKHADLYGRRSGRQLEVCAVSARDRSRDRGLDLSCLTWVESAADLAETDADIIVELIGGEEGVALALVEAALSRGKAVVTANKALIARHGTRLALLAEETGAVLAFEAAVAGGIPIVKALREGLAANRMVRIQGILNGTCNYILTIMRDTGRAFDDVLAEAQELGYAEADPSFDVDGVDTAHKLAILASLAYGCPIDFDAVHIEGIRHVSAVDIAFADELGYRIKLLGLTAMGPEGLEQRVHPCMVPVSVPIATIDGVYNAVMVDGDSVGTTVFQGRGAGAGPTASAVIADIIDIARGIRVPAFSESALTLTPAKTVSLESRVGPYYVRLMVVDRPGVIAEISACLRDHDISVGALIQKARKPGEPVPLVMTTHDVGEAAMTSALADIGGLDSVTEPPRMIRIESL